MCIEITKTDDRDIDTAIAMFTLNGYRVVGKMIDGKFYLVGVKL